LNRARVGHGHWRGFSPTLGDEFAPSASFAARRVFERVMKPVVVRFPEPIDQFEGFPL
jgi:hypothetical protein